MGKMKKYKGHTIIELKDPETGEVVKRVESDNMFTNAINKMVDFAMRHAYGTSGLQNMYTSHLWFFTGIIGWNGTIEEDEDNFWPPACSRRCTARLAWQTPAHRGSRWGHTTTRKATPRRHS